MSLSKERIVSTSAERMRKLRFFAKLEKRRARGETCFFCGKLLETLHHIDENHDNNRDYNLLNVCNDCHLLIPHNGEPSPDPEIARKLEEIKAWRGIRYPTPLSSYREDVTVAFRSKPRSVKTVTPFSSVNGQGRTIKVHYIILSRLGRIDRFFDSLEDFANYKKDNTQETTKC